MRAVFDTNVVVSALLFNGQVAWLRPAWATRRLVPLVNELLVVELRRVLAYSKFRLSDARQHALLAEYLLSAQRCDPPPPIPPWAQACSDKSDFIFLALAASEGVPLVTGDRVVAALGGAVPIVMLSPRALLDRLTP